MERKKIKYKVMYNCLLDMENHEKGFRKMCDNMVRDCIYHFNVRAEKDKNWIYSSDKYKYVMERRTDLLKYYVNECREFEKNFLDQYENVQQMNDKEEEEDRKINDNGKVEIFKELLYEQDELIENFLQIKKSFSNYVEKCDRMINSTILQGNGGLDNYDTTDYVNTTIKNHISDTEQAESEDKRGGKEEEDDDDNEEIENAKYCTIQ